MSIDYVIRTLTTEANRAARKFAESDGVGSSRYYSGLESGLRRALKLLKGRQKKTAKKLSNQRIPWLTRGRRKMPTKELQ